MRLFADDPYTSFGSMQIIVDPTMVEQYKFPRSKGKRIKKKFMKNNKNFRPKRHAIVNTRANIIICHPLILDQIKKEIGVNL